MEFNKLFGWGVIVGVTLFHIFDPVKLTPEEERKCKELGLLKPHPICVLSKMAEGKSRDVATKECLDEGKYHGISMLTCKAYLAGSRV